MTQSPEGNRTVTVAELLARNGGTTATTGRAHRRRARDGGISVAELTGEIPIIREPAQVESAEPEVAEVAEPEVADAPESDAAGAEVAEPEASEPEALGPEASEPESAEGADEAAAEEPVAESDAEAEPEAEVKSDVVAAPKSARKFEPETAAEQTRAYSAYDAVADSGPQSPREFASTASMPVMTPLSSSVLTAKADSTADADADSKPEQAELAETELADAELADAEPADAPESDKGALRQWTVLALQAVVGVVVGAALFIGFERLWDNLPYVALVLAILVIVAMVAVVRILRRTDDIVSVLIAVVVGIIVTIGPLAFVLSTS